MVVKTMFETGGASNVMSENVFIRLQLQRHFTNRLMSMADGMETVVNGEVTKCRWQLDIKPAR